jgi:hypothetical protein
MDTIELMYMILVDLQEVTRHKIIVVKSLWVI